MVVGETLIACIMARNPLSMRLAVSISPSRAGNATVPISRTHRRTGSVLRPNSALSVDG